MSPGKENYLWLRITGLDKLGITHTKKRVWGESVEIN